MRRPLVALGPSLAFVYFVMIGGSYIGEILGPLRVANSLLASILIVMYVKSADRRMDRVDRLVVVSLVFFVIAAALSEFPRQSLDAALAAFAYAAAFFVARSAFSNPQTRRVMVWTLRVMSVVVTAVVASRSLSVNLGWWSLTEGTVLPPVGLRIGAQPWGHPYDVVTLALMLYPAWFVGRMTRVRLAAVAAVGVPLATVVFLQGARAVWLAAVLATAAIGVTWLLHHGRPALSRHARLAASGISAIAVVTVIVFGGGILDRLLDSATIGQRLAMWTSATDAWLSHPVAGLGPGTFPWILQTTDYFATNSIHPRHPDTAFFQLLPEAGILGIASATVLLWAIVPALVRSGMRPAIWSLSVFVFGSIGANPTDFPYLVGTAIVWAGLALPRAGPMDGTDRKALPAVRALSYGCMAVIGLAVSAQLVAGLRYDEAAGAARVNDIGAVHRAMDAAVSLDPGMALYPRNRGVAALLLGEPDKAIPDLKRAVDVNPYDDLSWRSLALAEAAADDMEEAIRAIDRAIKLQPSDASNLLLRAYWEARAGDRTALHQTVAEIVLAWPTVVAAPGWTELVHGSISGVEAIDLAIQRWEEGLPSPEPLRSQPLWLAVFGDRLDLLDRAAPLGGLDHELVDATVATWRCEPDASALLSEMPRDLRRSSAYWALVVQQSAEAGPLDVTALELYGKASATSSIYPPALTYLDPLHENNAQGSVDVWGYDRGPITWAEPLVRLPYADTGATRLLLDPSGARRAMGFDNGPGSCP